jgi:hypothetical protein
VGVTPSPAAYGPSSRRAPPGFGTPTLPAMGIFHAVANNSHRDLVIHFIRRTLQEEFFYGITHAQRLDVNK